MTGRFIQKETAASRPLAAAPTGDSPVSYPNFPAFPQPLPGGQNISQPKLTRAAGPRSVLWPALVAEWPIWCARLRATTNGNGAPRRRRYRSQIGRYGSNDVMRCFFKSAGGSRSQKNCLREAASVTLRPWHAAVENIRGKTPDVPVLGETGRWFPSRIANSWSWFLNASGYRCRRPRTPRAWPCKPCSAWARF